VHLTNEKWHCACSSPHAPYDFEGKLTAAFGELLGPDAPDLCDAYAGPRETRAGDGLLAVPTLVHRGPGNPTSATEARCVLFFTLRPQYGDLREPGVDDLHHKYNPTLQIHASCILYNQVKKVHAIYDRSGCNLEGCFGAIVGRETASLMREVKELKEENQQLRAKRAKRDRGPADAASLRRKVQALTEENQRLRALLAEKVSGPAPAHVHEKNAREVQGMATDRGQRCRRAAG